MNTLLIISIHDQFKTKKHNFGLIIILLFSTQSYPCAFEKNRLHIPNLECMIPWAQK